MPRGVAGSTTVSSGLATGCAADRDGAATDDEGAADVEGVFLVHDGTVHFKAVATGIAGQEYFEARAGVKWLRGCHPVQRSHYSERARNRHERLVVDRPPRLRLG